MTTSVPSETTALLHDGHADNLQRVASNASRRSRFLSTTSQKPDFAGDGGDFETTYNAEAKILFKYSAPLIVTYLLQYSYTLVTVFVAGRLGTNELGAASLAGMTANITGLAAYEGLALSLDTLTSQAYGGGKKRLVGLHVQRMMALMLVATIPIGILWICSPWIMAALVPEKELAYLAGSFLRIYLIGAPGYGIFEAAKRLTQAQGNFIASLVPTLICVPLNILFNWFFVFKLGLGFEGAALSVAVSYTLQPIIFLIYVNLFAKHTLECWPSFTIKSSLENWGEMIKLSIPGILMVLSEWLAFDILTFTSSYIGTPQLAAQSVLMTIAVTMYHIPMPISIAASTRFGNLIGFGALNAARKAIVFYYLVFIGVGVFDMVLLTSLRHVVAIGFSNDEAVRAIVVRTLPIVAAAQTLDSLCSGTNAMLRGLGRQKFGGYINLGVYYVWAVPLSLLLTFGPLRLGLIGLWTGPLSGLGVSAVIATIYIKRTNWQDAVEESRIRGGE